MNADKLTEIGEMLDALASYNEVCKHWYRLRADLRDDQWTLRCTYDRAIHSGPAKVITKFLIERTQEQLRENRLSQFAPQLKVLFEETELSKDGFVEFVKRSL